MKTGRKINVTDIYKMKSPIAFGLFVLMVGVLAATTVSKVVAQEPSIVEIAHASIPVKAEVPGDYRYKGMPELRAPLDTMEYPEEARRMGVEGRVVVSYTVNEEGDVIEAAVLWGLGYGCDEEALRIIQGAEFKPVLNKEGRAQVKTFVTPITFRLN